VERLLVLQGETPTPMANAEGAMAWKKEETSFSLRDVKQLIEAAPHLRWRRPE